MNNFGSAKVPNATYQVSKAITQLIPEKKIFQNFYHTWAWRPRWRCDLNPFKPKGFFHPYYLEESILHFKDVRLILSS